MAELDEIEDTILTYFQGDVEEQISAYLLVVGTTIKRGIYTRTAFPNKMSFFMDAVIRTNINRTLKPFNVR